MCVSSESLIMIVMAFSMEMTGYDNSVHMAHKIKKISCSGMQKGGCGDGEESSITLLTVCKVIRIT